MRTKVSAAWAAVLLAIMCGVPGSALAEIGDASDYEFGTIARTGTIASVQEDVAPSPAQRVTSVAVRQDLEARTMTATATFAAAPTVEAQSVVYVYFGKSSYSDGCVQEFAIAGVAGGDGQDAAGSFIGAEGTPGAAISVTRSLAGAVLTLTSAAHDDIRANDWDCAFADVRTAGSPSTRLQIFRWTRLEATEIPVLQVNAGRPTQGSYAGRWTTISVDVRNSGNVDAAGVTVSVSGRGLKYKKRVRQIGTLSDRASKYGLKFRVRMTSAKQRTLTVRAHATGARPDTHAVRIVRKPRPKVPASLVGRYFWGSEQSSLSDTSGWRNHGIHFVSKRHAFMGFDKGDKLPKCRATTKLCRPYSWNPRTGVLRIKGHRSTRLDSEGFELRTGKTASTEVFFRPLTLPRKGTRFTADLKRDDWNGNCMISCTTTSERIAFARSGRFLRSRSSIGSWPGLGTTWSIAPPNMRGRWKVVSTGRIELRYADGTVERAVLGIEQDVRGRASAGDEGLLLNGRNYYP